LGQDQDEINFKVDAVKQRAYVKISTVATGHVSGEYWLIWIPPGAPENSDATKGYVLFTVQDSNQNDTSTASFCSYRTTNKIKFGTDLMYPPVAFPDHWDRLDIINIQSWIEIPEFMKYQGMVSENGVEYDEWISTDLCSETDFGILPCDKISTIKDTNIPASLFLAKEVQCVILCF